MAHARVVARAVWLLCLVACLAAPGAFAAPRITVTGPASRGPLEPDADGRFAFPDLPLLRNAVNTFTVTATDDFGNSQSQDVRITQIDLANVVVSQVASRPLSVQEVEQLVQDGVIDLEDPENYNVSSFNIVLTIERQEIPISIPIVRGRQEPMGSEDITPISDPGAGNSNPRVPDVEIVVFELAPSVPGFEPPRIPGVIIIQGDIKTLKEFFEVRLLLMNTSGIFTLSDVQAMIAFPEGGLSPTLPEDGIALFDDILPGDGGTPGQKQREFIIRGDEIGRRPIEVSFGGTITGPGIPEEEPIPFNGSARTAVEVKGPPTFDVRVTHPDEVTAGVPYELAVDITNTGEAPALYASLELSIGADAEIVECEIDEITELPVCEPIDPPAIRRFGHIFPGTRVREVFTVLPHTTGRVTSCMGVADQNIALQVLVGNIGCITGNFPVVRDSVNGVPAYNVLPLPNAFGVSTSSPVVAFFTELMNESTITTGSPSASFRVLDDSGTDVPGQLRFTTLTDRTIAIWQAVGTTARLADNTRHTIHLADTIEDLSGTPVANEWTSTFVTTSNTDDETPPFLTLSIEPPVDPTRVLPGQLIQINAYPTDQGSGVSAVELRMRDTDVPDAPEQLVDQKTIFSLSEQGPCIFAIDSGNLVPGHTYQFRATAIDNANNRQDATIAAIIATTAAAPQMVLPDDPADPILHGISVPLAPVSISPTVRSVAYYLDFDVDPFATLFLAPFQTAVTTLGLPLGAHTVRAVATDALGQVAEDIFEFELVANVNEPTVDFGGFAGGRYTIGSRIPINGDAEDPFGITAAAFFLDDPNGAALATGLGGFQLDTAGLAPGVHRLFLIATNAVGNSNDPAAAGSFVDFEVVETPVAGDPPAAPVLAPLAVPIGGRTTVSGTANAGGQLTLTNMTQGFVATFAVGADGAFSRAIDADPGDSIHVTVLDLAVSSTPSPAAMAVVPAPPAATALRIAPGSLAFAARGAFADLVVTADFDDGSSSVVTSAAALSSGNPAVASVNGAGRVVAQGSGATQVTATFGGLTASASVAVDIVTLTGLVVTPTPLVLDAVGASADLVVRGSYSDGSEAVLASGIAFASSNPGVVLVGGSGRVTAISGGAATVFVSATGVPAVAVPVTVDALDSPPTVVFQAPSAGAEFERGDNVPVTAFATDAVGVVRVRLTASGAASISETRQITPVATSTTAGFSFGVPSDAAVGGTITLSLEAEDTGGNFSTLATRTITVVDRTDPVVTITSPAIDAGFSFGEEVEVVIAASDAVAVSQIRFEVAGIDGAAGAQTFAPPRADAGATFSFTIPSDLVSPQVQILAYASDPSGNEGASAPVPITITGLDSTPPATIATAASTPSGATTAVSFQVTDGLADLDHVELYFRRNGIGTFNRYTGPLGDGDGEYTPQSGALGSIAFDATRMGGDGAYEFFTIGVDRSGNREAPPEDAGAIVGDPGVAATFATGAPVTVITTDTEIATGALDGANLRVDGATLTLVGTRSFGNVELLNGAVLTHRETTQTEAYGVEVSAWTVSVDATSRIDVVGRGHLGGNRAGLGETAHTSGFEPGAQSGAGGSYGGLGGDFSGNGASIPNPVYGNLVNPVDLGSGGGAWGGAGGDGGGRVLVGAINLALDGAITANGGLSSGSASGEGSGGSVNLTLRTLSGAGAISADGGTTNNANHTGGGGGRIAIRSLDRETYDAARITTRGGDGFYGDGADGTAVLIGEGGTGTELVINGLGAGTTITDLIVPPGQTFDSITLQNGANVLAQGPIVLARTLLLRGNSRLAHPTASEAGLSITAREVIVESGSAIDVTGRGYLGGNKAGLGETAHTLGFVAGSERATGGSHGGLGGAWSGGGGLATPVYGDPKRPNRLGAGGGAWGGNGGDGGGFVRIVASDRVVVDGAIHANGGISAGSASGEGAGGSIWIDTARLAGTGTISADGGTQNNANHTGGGGGRIAIYADFVDPSADLGGLRNVTANGGDGFYGDAAAGTVFLHLPGDVDGALIVDGVRAPGQTNPLATELPPIGPGIAAAVTADSLVLDGTLPRANTPDALVGLRINPNRDQAETFEIASNTADTITVVTPNENGIAFASVAAAGADYAGAWHFDRVRFRRGGNLEVADPLFVADELVVAETSLLAHPETTAVYAADLVIDAGTISIDATSRIDVTGRGHLGGNRAGLGEVAHTVGFAPGAQRATGGSHGGLGGSWSGNGGDVTNPVYGNPSEPRELGAGGGAWSGAGGDGGGRIAIVADALVVDGALRADGGISAGSASGEGAGGSLDLRIGSLSGAGVISASGGTQNNGNHTGGGGGRIAIRHGGAFTLPLANVRATGGDGFYGDGGHGSVFVLAPGQSRGDVIYDGHGFTAPVDSVVIPDTITADNLILRNGVRAVGRQITVDTLRVEAGASLTHAPQSVFGLEIEARRLVVESGAAIDVTGRGHLGGDRVPGVADTAHTLNFQLGSEAGAGGSHGGLGGDYSGNGSRGPSPIYGDVRRPAELGGGGGSWSGVGGDGGGIVRVFASESVDVDGAIRANGGISAGTASGEGAGGSVWIETGTFGGGGSVSADGGTQNGGNHTGGGGGRVAIHASTVDASSDLLGARRATAYGGDGFYGDGAPGTVFVALDGVETLIFDAGRTSDRWAPETSLPPVGPGVATNVTADSFDVDGTLPAPGVRDFHLAGLRVNPDTTQAESFFIETNFGRSVVVRTPNENGVHFADVASEGATYAGVWRFANVVLRGGASVALFDPITVDGTLAVTERSLLTHPDATDVYAPALDVEAGTLAIDATSSIDVTARGHLGGDRVPGVADTAHTTGFALGAEAGAGGSYGGLGGDYSGNGARGPNPVYGDASDPVELGSGGGAWSGAGGDGGGRVLLDVGALVLDGAIRANGGISAGSASGEGSGGTVNVRSGSIAGSGAISADGGTQNNGNHTGGGGGRVAIRWTSPAGPLPVSATASPGDGFYGDGQPGSVFLDGP